MVGFALRKLRFVGRGVAIEDKVADFFEIFKSTRLFFIFNLLALFVFIVLPQGKDVILIVIEDLSGFKVGSLVSLLLGLFGWCIISEFGARYKIYVTDNSGLSLTDERVHFRKEAQKFVSSFYLLLPVVIVMLSIIVVSVNNVKNWALHDILPFAIVLLLLVLVFALLSKFYLDDFYIGKLRKKAVWYKVRDVELDWANKLYGIYNDYVFLVRKANNFKDDKNIIKDNKEILDLPPNPGIKNTYLRFTDFIEELPPKNKIHPANTVESFPRDFLKPGELAPIEYKEVVFHKDNLRPVFNKEFIGDKTQPEFIYEENPDGFYRWIYTCNPSFYKSLHLQVHVIAIASILFLFLVSVNISPLIYQFIGSPALVCLAFACWLGIYTGLLYIDSRFKRKIKISVRWVLFLWLFFASFINDDHPVRNNKNVGFTTARTSLKDHFDWWSKSHLSDSNKNWVYKINMVDSIKLDTVKSYPVYFVTAEGGALRTGAFTAMLLARLQDLFPTFKNHIYAFSTVSGGSVGISFFNAISFLEPDTTANSKNYYQATTQKFFAQDQLSPVIAKLFYADILNNFWPWHIESFDRAIVLEKAWENSYANVFKKPNDNNVFSANFMSCYPPTDSTKRILPAWFINTTEVETGLQCYISNVRPDSFLFEKDRDLISNKIRYGINYSTAVNFSSRFPLFSPSAALYQNDDQTYHYVDGGYVENTGAKTMLEIIQSLHSEIGRKGILPYVIQLKFGDSTHLGQTGFLNEMSSILNGIYNTRAGASATYTGLLKKEVKSLGGQFIEVPLAASGQEVPMSWVFSKRSLNNLDSVIERTMNDPLNDLHRKLPEFQKDPHKSIK